MYEDLVEKLVEVGEAAVSTEASPVKKLMAYSRKVLNNKLALSSYPWEKWYKFWMLPSGDVIPVVGSHDAVLSAAGVRYSEAYNGGIVRGLIDPNTESLNIEAIRLSSQQISKLMQLYVEYKPTSVVLEVDSLPDVMYSDIKSADHLEYLLQYGKDEVDEAAVKVSSIDKMARKYKNCSTKLVKSSFCPSEEDQYKFWLLPDGTMISVGRNTHTQLADKANADVVELLQQGAIRGYVRKGEDMGVHWENGRPPTQPQMQKLRSLFIEYKIDTLWVETDTTNFGREVSSTTALEYFLEYGEKVHEAVDTKLSPEKQFRKYYAKKINGKLTKSTWGSESDWLKFLLLRNGDYVPVVHAHLDTILDSGITFIDSNRMGLVSGGIQLGARQLNLRGDVGSLTDDQIARIRQFYIEYKPDILFVDFPGRHTIGCFHKDIVPSEDLSYALEYGLDESIDEGVEVPEYLYHGTFKPLLDKINSVGLKISGTEKNYSDSEEGFIYLAKTFEEAEAFAEVSETVPDEWIDQIVVLKIETAQLDKSKIANDLNVRDTEVMTFTYSQDIPPEALHVMMPSSGVDEDVSSSSSYLGDKRRWLDSSKW